MGYEMRFYVVNKMPVKDQIENGEFYYGQTIAMYDYCCDYYLADFINKNSKPTDTYIYVGEEQVIKDCYGEFLAEININDLLEYLRNDKEEYRRKLPFIKMLEGFKEEKHHFEHLAILRYGY